jgi:FtsP/CotA-like multicopper oxidase with cupredoxin domain
MGMMHGMRGGMMHGMMGRRRGFGLQEGPLLEPLYDGYAVNGKIYPAVDPIVVNKGDRMKLRLLNPSSATIYELRLAGHVFTVTHIDGNAIMPMETDVLRIGMGERYDVMVVANNPGYWLLTARESGYGEGKLRVPLLYKGVSRKNPIPPEFHPGLRFATYWDFQALNPSEDSPTEAPNRFYPQRLNSLLDDQWTGLPLCRTADGPTRRPHCNNLLEPKHDASPYAFAWAFFQSSESFITSRLLDNEGHHQCGSNEASRDRISC